MASKCRILFTVFLILACGGAVAAESLTAEQVQELLPSRNDIYYGESVSVDGDTAVIGDHADPGAAFVFVRTDGVWTQQAFLRSPSDVSSPGTHFGRSVSLDGNTAVIGAPLDYRTLGVREPSAYVFVRTDGVWTQQARLRPGDGLHEDSNFGYSVSLDGDTAVIGAATDDDSGQISGSAYVFVRMDGVWTQQAKLLARDGTEGDFFGGSVSLDGDTALIGAPWDDNDPPLYGSGSAYIFIRSGHSWRQKTKLLADDGSLEDRFGLSVSLDGDTALIGAHLDDDNGDASGSAYVFTRFGGRGWRQQAKLLAEIGMEDDRFGRSVSVDGDTAVIGALQFDWSYPKTGSAYVLVRTDGVWTQQAKLQTDDRAVGNLFGYSASLDGDTVVIGAPSLPDFGGRAYVFRLVRSGPGFLVIAQADTDAPISPVEEIIDDLVAEE